MALVGLMTACETSGTDDAVPIARADAIAAIAHRLDGVSTLHSATELVGLAGDASAVLIRSETWVDVNADTAYAVVTEPVEPLSEDFRMTEETVLLDGRALLRPDGGEWTETNASVGAMVFSGFDEAGEDFESTLSELIAAASDEWSMTGSSDGGEAVYLSGDDSGQRSVEIETDDQGRPIRITIRQRPTGAEPNDPRRFEMTLRLTEFDTAEVVLPSDLPEST